MVNIYLHKQITQLASECDYLFRLRLNLIFVVNRSVVEVLMIVHRPLPDGPQPHLPLVVLLLLPRACALQVLDAAADSTGATL